MASPMHVIAVEPLSDADVLAVAHCIVLDLDMFPYPSAIFGLRDAAARAWIARDVPRDAVERTAVLGFLAGHVRRRTLQIEGLAVHRDSRRRGIGRALVREAVDEAHAQAMRSVALHVSVANHAAIALYRAEGFDVGRRVRRFYSPAAYDGETDAYEMELRIGAWI